MIPPPESPEFAEWNRQREEETRQMRAEADCRARAESWAKFQQKVQLGRDLDAWKAHVAEAERNQPSLFEDMRSHIVIEPGNLVVGGIQCVEIGWSGAVAGGALLAPVGVPQAGVMGGGAAGCALGFFWGHEGPLYPSLA